MDHKSPSLIQKEVYGPTFDIAERLDASHTACIPNLTPSLMRAGDG